MGERQKILVLYATQTGTAEDVAERIGREAARRGYNPLVLSIDKYDPRQLSYEKTIVFVAATTGQGDCPDTMKSFWNYFRQKLSNKLLVDVHYAVFGLGDSGYQKFNVVAKKLHNRLAGLGAKPISQKGLGDDQHPSGYEGVLDPWLASLWTSIGQIIPSASNADVTDDMKLDPPKYKVTYFIGGAPFTASSSSDVITDVQRKWIEHDRARNMVEAASGMLAPQLLVPDTHTLGHTPNNPIFGQMINNVRLTDPDYEQDVRHLEFDLGDSGLEYSPGDVCGVIPQQDPKQVDDFLERCGLNPDSYVVVECREATSQSEIRPVTIRNLVEGVMDIGSATPRRYFFEVMAHFAQAEHEKERLEYFATPEGRDDLYKYNQRENRTVIEVLEDFPSVNLPLEWLIQLVPRVRPRYFSISSSLKAHPNELHLTVAIVKWKTPYKRQKTGLCSSWLSQLDPKRGVVPIWTKSGVMKLPPPSVPVILVGPGTGCAPFRSFIEERAAVSKVQTGVAAPVLFFFGCRYEKKDFIYKELWREMQKGKEGVLSEENGGGFEVAFSRDKAEKVYVGHKIREKSKLVMSLLHKGGAIFVSGSANKMPADVLNAFKDVIVNETSESDEAASLWLKELEKRGRYSVEVWT